MNRLFLAFSVAGLLPMSASSAQAASPQANLAVPAGAYQTVRLTVQDLWRKGQPGQILLHFRQGRAVRAWLMTQGKLPLDAHRLWDDQLDLRLDETGLEGKLGGRLVQIWAPTAHPGDWEASLECTLDGGKISGRALFRVLQAGTEKLNLPTTVAGEALDEAALRRQALPPDKDWPCYYGTGGNLGPSCGATMVEDLADARPLWRSEQTLPTCWGNAPDARYADRAAFTGVTGGASSPIVAGGRVYLYYYTPSGALPPGRTEADIHKPLQGRTAHPLALAAAIDFWRPRCDDHVVCMDAATGKTLWHTTLPDAGFNHQTHKWRGGNCTPCLAEGRLYVMNYSRAIFALDAAEGKLLWWNDAHALKTIQKDCIRTAGPMCADGVVALPLGNETVGLEAATGRQLWKGPGGNCVVWTGGGSAPCFILDAACVQARTGKTLWKIDQKVHNHWYTPIVSGDRLLFFVETAKGNNTGHFDLLCYGLSEAEPNLLWRIAAPQPMTDCYGITVAKGHVLVDGETEAWAIALADGKIECKATGVGGARTQIAVAGDDRLIIQNEGRHGKAGFFLLDIANPKALRALSAQPRTPQGTVVPWTPPHPPTTAYANFPITYPLVDGRLFVRGADGIYCYDLRKPTPSR